MTDFEWEVIEDMYTWADATSFDIEADRKHDDRCVLERLLWGLTP